MALFDIGTPQFGDVRVRLAALTAEQYTALRNYYHYLVLQTQVRGLGWVNLILCGVTYWLSQNPYGDPSFKQVQGLLGLAGVVISLLSIVTPIRMGFGSWVAVLAGYGAWNLFVGFRAENYVVIAFGVLQLWWAYGLFVQMRANQQTTRPEIETVQLYNELLRDAKQMRARDGYPEFFELKLYRRWWHGLFLQDRCLLVYRDGKTLLIADRDKTTFTFKDARDLVGSRIVGTIAFDEIPLTRATFPQETFRRYSRWKGQTEEQITAWLDELDRNTKKRLPARIVVLLLMAAPVIVLLFWLVVGLIAIAKYN